MPRLTAARRLSIMSAALAFGEDRSAAGQDAVTIDEIAASLEERAEDVRESLEPLEWVEFRTPEGIVDLLDSIRLDDNVLTVQRAWWRRLATLDASEAARLYTKAASAASIEAAQSPHLRSAMAKLRRKVGEITVVEGDAPRIVYTLRKARDTGVPVLINMEGRDKTVVTTGATFRVVSVYRSGNEWMTVLESSRGNVELGLSGGDPITVPVRRLLGVLPARSDRQPPDSSPSIYDIDRVVEVVLEYPVSRDWVLDPYSPTDQADIGEGRRRARVEVWGTSELKTLMLRLGPGAAVVQPNDLVGIQREAALQVLELYDS